MAEGTLMMPTPIPARRTLPWLAAALALQGCAAGPTAPVTTAQTPPDNTGTVLAIRNVNVEGSNAAVNKILTTLGQPPANSPESAEEVIIRRPDHSVVSVIEPAQPGEPGFVPGETVVIVASTTTAIRPE